MLDNNNYEIELIHRKQELQERLEQRAIIQPFVDRPIATRKRFSLKTIIPTLISHIQPARILGRPRPGRL
jgi:hypothetical protein